MLVLSRKTDEQVLIGDDIVITIVDIRGDKVRLGIDAPKATPVHRREVYDAIKRDAARNPAPLVRSALLGSMPAVAMAVG